MSPYLSAVVSEVTLDLALTGQRLGCPMKGGTVGGPWHLSLQPRQELFLHPIGLLPTESQGGQGARRMAHRVPHDAEEGPFEENAELRETAGGEAVAAFHGGRVLGTERVSQAPPGVIPHRQRRAWAKAGG